MTKITYKQIAQLILLAFIAILISGCASILDIGAYKNGTPVTEATLNNIVLDRTTADELRNILGQPSKIELHNGKIRWYYDYTKINRFDKRINECNIFIINSNNVVIGHHLSSRRATPTGNASADSAIEYYRW